MNSEKRVLVSLKTDTDKSKLLVLRKVQRVNTEKIKVSGRGGKI